MTQLAPSLFVDAWETYRKIVSANHMFHREIGTELRQALRERFEGRPITILDLGCGDASTLVPLLEGIVVARYEGVDLAEPALALAAENLKALSCPADLVREDILAALAEDRSWDVIHTSFALHHLRTELKAEFFRRVGRRLAPGGFFLLVDVVREEDETLVTYHEHYCHWLRDAWTGLDPSERELLCDHIVANDMPEPYSTLEGLARAAGLRVTTPSARFGWHRLMSFTRA